MIIRSIRGNCRVHSRAGWIATGSERGSGEDAGGEPALAAAVLLLEATDEPGGVLCRSCHTEIEDPLATLTVPKGIKRNMPVGRLWSSERSCIRDPVEQNLKKPLCRESGV